MINFTAITPHPPIIIPGIGTFSDKEKVSKTIKAMERLSKIFVHKKPDTIILISPHGPVSYNEMTVGVSPTLIGDFRSFGEYQTKLDFKNDLEVTNSIYEKCEKEKIPINLDESPELDHGCLVPLYYFKKEYNGEKFPTIVPMTYSFLDPETHFNFGKAIFDICNMIDKKIAIVASGDLSHRLTLDAPAGFSPQGKEFDDKLINLLKKGNIKEIIKIDKGLIKRVGECGYLSIVILLGVLSEIKKFEFELFSYEGPFGVGYMVGHFLV